MRPSGSLQPGFPVSTEGSPAASWEERERHCDWRRAFTGKWQDQTSFFVENSFPYIVLEVWFKYVLLNITQLGIDVGCFVVPFRGAECGLQNYPTR
jgi:hypothetical protein